MAAGVSLVTHGLVSGSSSGGGGGGGTAALANPQPSSGSSLNLTDRTVARHTPVSFNVYDGGSPVSGSTTPWCICIKYANDDRGFVIYDSTTGFYPPFHHLSTWKASTALMSVLPDGGWQDAIEQIYVGGQSDDAIVPIRYGAAGSDKPPNAP